jgi:tetratricopeptide (TPR) repeat protein
MRVTRFKKGSVPTLFLFVAARLFISPDLLLSADAIGQHSTGTSLAARYIEAAKIAMQAQNLSEARKQLMLALQADPRAAEGYLLLGIIEFRSGETARAIDHYRHAIRWQPHSFSVHYNLALAYIRNKDLDSGRHELERAISLDPKNLDAVYNLGVVDLELGRAREALIYLHKARSLGAHRADVEFSIVRASLTIGDPETARREVAQSVNWLGEDADWQAAVGELFLHHGLARDAVAHLRQAIRLTSSSDDIRRELATAYIESQQPDLALELLHSPSSPDDHYLRASAFYGLHKLAESENELQAALNLKPTEPRFLLLEARIRQHRGEHESALAILRRDIELAPEWAAPRYSAAVSCYFEHRYEDARLNLDHAIKLDPSSARALFLYGATLVNEGRSAEAERFIRRALSLQPDNPRFQYHLGALLLRSDHLSEARVALEKSIQLGPDYAMPHYELGKLLLHSNEPAKAIQELKHAIRQQPDLSQAYYQLSRAYALNGEQQRSKDALSVFKNLKKQQLNEDEEFSEEVKKDLGMSVQ